MSAEQQGPQRRRPIAQPLELTDCEQNICTSLESLRGVFSSRAVKTLSGNLGIRFYNGPFDGIEPLRKSLVRKLAKLQAKEEIGWSCCAQVGNELHVKVSLPLEVTEPPSQLWTAVFVVSFILFTFTVITTRW